MQRRAAADDVDVFNVAQTLIGQSVVLETDGIVLDAGGHGICNSLRLLHDLLEHEVLIAALFCCGHIPVDGLNFLFDFVAEFVHDNDFIRTHDRYFVVVKNDELPGTADNSGDIRCDHVFAFTDTDDERIAAARCDDFLCIIHRYNAECVRAAQTLHGSQNGFCKILLLAGVQIVDKMRNGFGVGLGLELITMRFKAFAQFLVVFNDAVVNDCNLALAAEMRMRVAVGRFAVSRPAGVADAAGAFHIAADLTDLLLKVSDAAAGLYDAQAFLSECGDTGRVISAIFQTVQTLDQNGERIFASRKTNNSTHNQFTPPKRNIFIKRLKSKRKIFIPGFGHKNSA